MRRISPNKGFSAVEVIIVVIVLAVLVALGVALYKTMTTSDTDTTQSADSSTSVDSPAFESTADLDSASAEIDNLDLSDDGDDSRLESEQAAF